MYAQDLQILVGRTSDSCSSSDEEKYGVEGTSDEAMRRFNRPAQLAKVCTPVCPCVSDVLDSTFLHTYGYAR